MVISVVVVTSGVVLVSAVDTSVVVVDSTPH